MVIAGPVAEAAAGAGVGSALAALATADFVAAIVPAAFCAVGVARADEVCVSVAGSAAAGAGISAGFADAFSTASAAAGALAFGAAVDAESVVGAELESVEAPKETVTVLPPALMSYRAGWRRSITTRETSGENWDMRISRTGSRLLAICFAAVVRCEPAKSKTSRSGFCRCIEW